ncbi:MAG: type I methionyl aminopeptidase [Chloroflexi bacterium]|nr:type I methionyl aminopeptidase [Chloroflexota bacterium]
MIILKTAHELALMREAGRIVAEVHAELRERLRPGVTTGELDTLAEEIIGERGAVPSFKGYRGFPAAICASINEEVVHGIPSNHRRLREGDIISVDVGAIYQGYHGDSAWTYAIGAVGEEACRLLEATEGALYAGIAQARAGHRFGDIAAAIQKYVESRGFSVVREYTGHGIGKRMHEDPQILHYVHPKDPNRNHRLRPGMTFALEPMVNIGTWKTDVLTDGWTVVTEDRQLSAHFEHTLAITDGAAEILTRL